MQIEHLRYFIALEQYKSINKTSQMMNTAPQNLSRILKNMEMEFGSELFYRTPNGITFTASGMDFMQFAKNTVYQYDFLQSKHSFNQHNNNNADQEITVFSQNTINEAILNDILIDFFKEYPNILVNNILGDYQSGYKKLFDTADALGILLHYDNDTYNTTLEKNYDIVPLLHTHTVAIVHKDHPFAQKDMVNAKNCVGQTLIILTRDSYDDTEIPFLLDKFHLTEQVSVISIGDLKTCYRLVREKNYICPGTLESFNRQDEKTRADLVAVPIADHLYATYALIKPKTLPPHSAQQLFFNFVLEYMQIHQSKHS